MVHVLPRLNYRSNELFIGGYKRKELPFVFTKSIYPGADIEIKYDGILIADSVYDYIIHIKIKDVDKDPDITEEDMIQELSDRLKYMTGVNGYEIYLNNKRIQI